MRRTFQPETGALARKFIRNMALGPLASRVAANCQPMSPVRNRQSPKRQRDSSAAGGSFPVEVKTQSAKPLQQALSRQLQAMKSASLPSLLERQPCGPSKAVPREREAGALLGRAVSQSEVKQSSLMDLIRAAQRNIRVDELPSAVAAKDAVAAKVAAPVLRQEARPLKMAPESTSTRRMEGPKAFPEGPKVKPHASWSTKEESNQLSQELARLGRPMEPMAWANDEIENKWLRREATYEMFKSLLGTTSPQQEGAASTTACGGSTRSHTPDLSSAGGLAFEHDALSNFVGKDMPALMSL